jgi:hypothetical protein
MTRWVIGLFTTATLTLVSLAAGQGNPTLAGSWALDQSGGGRGGVRGIPIATELVIKVDPSQVTMESNTGSARAFQTFVYALDGSEIDVPGPLGWSNTASARWEGDRLVVSSKRTLEGGPDGPMSVEVIDVFVVEGDAMTIERRQGRRSDRLVYNRTR